MATVKALEKHQDVQSAYTHYNERHFHTSEDTVYAFWANDVERDKTGKVIEHHGRACALKFQAKSHHENKQPVVLMENFEGKNGVEVLNDYEKRPDISPMVCSAVCAAASASYAKSAQSTILTSVKGAAANSFFRTHELPIVMNNPNITHVIIVSRENPEGSTYSKKQAYHILRDEWSESAKQKFQEATVKFQDKKIHKVVYQSAVDSLAAEIAISVRGLDMSKPSVNIDTEYQHYGTDDIIKELQRVQNYKSLLRDNPGLLQKVKDKLVADDTISITKQVLSCLNDETSRQPISTPTPTPTPTPPRRSSIIPSVAICSH
jgi:hypothetical protein